MLKKHIVFIFTTIAGSFYLAKIRIMAESENLKKHSLEKIFGMILVSLLWILFGFYKNIDSATLDNEVMVFCFLLILFLLKLNSSKSNKFFGKLVPGHGKEENKVAIVTKYIVLYAVGIVLFIFIIFVLLGLI